MYLLILLIIIWISIINFILLLFNLGNPYNNAFKDIIMTGPVLTLCYCRYTVYTLQERDQGWG